MGSGKRGIALALCLLVQAGGAALAQEAAHSEAVSPAPSEEERERGGAQDQEGQGAAFAEGEDGDAETPEDTGADVRDPWAEIQELRDRLEALEFEAEQSARRQREAFRFGAYLDVGLFWAEGNGSGTRTDLGHRYFPKYQGQVPDSWVFWGDPLATAINARGEAADTGESRAVSFDSVDSRGAVSFLVNTLTVSGFYAPRHNLTVGTLVDFVPRVRNASDASGVGLGDFIDVQLAYLEYRPDFEKIDMEISLGKFDSVLGVEYRTQDAPDRIEVTPSLICRYTCGRPVGAKLRMRFLDDRALVLNMAITNGSHFSERFAYTADVDMNDAPTGAARLSYKLPIGEGVEIGASGMAGAQDLQEKNEVFHWQAGGDLLADGTRVVFASEFVIGNAAGDQLVGDIRCSLAPCLEYRGGYARLGVRVTNWLLPYVRSDFRRAVHQDGASFVYISRLARATAGIRFEINEHVLWKAEYTYARELGPGAQIPNNVATSSFVVH